MRILFSARTYLPITGGLQASTHSLALRMARRGHEVAVLTTLLRPRSARSRLFRAGRELRRRPVVSEDTELGYPRFRALRPGEGIRVATEHWGPDLVVAGGGGENTLDHSEAVLGGAGAAGRALYVRDVASVPLAQRWRERGALVLANAERLAEMVGPGVPVIPSIIEPDDYRVSTSRRVVLFVNPTPDRGLDTAWAVAAARPSVPFVFQQAWPMTAEQREELVTRAGSTPNVTFRDATDDPAVLYGDARVLLAPYVVPNRPRVIHEAGLAGIPTIATGAGGLVEATGRGGRLVDPGAGTAEWAAALDELWADEGAYEEAAAAARVHAARPEMDPEHLSARFEELVTAYQRPT
jgi:glycosyltransferase involved in cell wall biosynthesis